MKRRWVPTALILVLAALALPAAAAPPSTGPRDITKLHDGDRLTDAEAATFRVHTEGRYGPNEAIPASALRVVTNGQGEQLTAIHNVTTLTIYENGTSVQGAAPSGVPSNDWCAFDMDAAYREAGGTAFLSNGRCSNSNRLYPTSLQVIWYKQSIDVPSGQRIQQHSEQKRCHILNSYCLGAGFHWEVNADTVNQTSALFPVFILTVQTGKQDRWEAERWFFNDNGYAYPRFIDTRGSASVIPFRFPQWGWGTCEDNLVPGACDRGSTFPDRIRQHYRNNGWPIPNPGVVHHITPLQYGGSDRQIDNGEILSPENHDFFTFRFFNSSFRPRPL